MAVTGSTSLGCAYRPPRCGVKYAAKSLPANPASHRNVVDRSGVRKKKRHSLFGSTNHQISRHTVQIKTTSRHHSTGSQKRKKEKSKKIQTDVWLALGVTPQ